MNLFVNTLHRLHLYAHLKGEATVPKRRRMQELRIVSSGNHFLHEGEKRTLD